MQIFVCCPTALYKDAIHNYGACYLATYTIYIYIYIYIYITSYIANAINISFCYLACLD